MDIRLSERIRNNRNSFSKGQRLIAQYIEQYPDEVAFMTASRLGMAVGVSESTVVRFATEIGYSGYPALLQAIQEMIRSNLTSVQRLEMTSRNLQKQQLLDSVLDQDINILRRTKESVDHRLFYETANVLVNANKVYILSAGSSLALGTFMKHYFELLFENVRLIEATSEAQIFQQMIQLKGGDAIMAISFPRYSRKAARALRYAKDQGAATIAITDSALSPLAAHASHLLLARSDMVSLVDSLVGPLSIINALIVTVAIEKKKEVANTLNQLEDIWEQYGIFEKMDEKGNSV